MTSRELFSVAVIWTPFRVARSARRQPVELGTHRSARARAARDARGLPRGGHPQLAALRRGGGDQALPEQMVRSAGDAIISIDRRGSITGWNPAAEQIFGWSAREAIGRSLVGTFPAEYEQAARHALTGARPASTFDLTAKRADGKMLNLAVTLSGVPGREGRVEGLLAIVRDMTSQRELETQMHQSEKLTALGQVAGGIAHDFNNLLQAILGYSQLMSKNLQNTDVVRRGLSVIETAAVGGAETVRRIQKFARLRPDEPFVSVELNQVVHDAVA